MIMKKINFLLIIFLFLAKIAYPNTSTINEKQKFIILNKQFEPGSYIMEDIYGYIIISKKDGFYKFNGHDFIYTSYESFLGEKFYSENRRYKLTKDNLNNIWIRSYKGQLLKKDTTGNFTDFSNQLELKNKGEYITNTIPYNNDVWFSSNKGSIYKYDSSKEYFYRVFSIPEIKNRTQKISDFDISGATVMVSSKMGKLYSYSIKHKTITKIDFQEIDINEFIGIASDKNGDFWISTEVNGVFKISKENNIPIQVLNPINKIDSKQKFPLVIFLYCDSDNNIWLGTDGDGLYKINTDNNNITIYKKNDYNRFSISNNTIRNIYEDSNKNIWLVGKLGKINILPGAESDIKYHSGHYKNIAMRVLSILKDKDSTIWSGTDGYGLNRYKPGKTSIQYSPEQKGKYYFPGKYIQGLQQDKNGNIWIATYKNGLWKLNPNTNKFKKIETPNSKGVMLEDIRSLYIDPYGRIWAASGISLDVYSQNGKLLAVFDYNNNGLSRTIVNNICSDENNNIWISAYESGLYKFIENKKDFSNSYFEQKSNPIIEKSDDVVDGNITYLTPDMKGNLWLVLEHKYISKYNIKDNTYTLLNNLTSLNNKTICSILIDNDYNLWLSSSKGIHKYDINSKNIKSFFNFDGSKNNSFIVRSAFKDKDGVLYFGGNNGINYFLPDNMSKEEKTANLYINSIHILNKPGVNILPDQLKSDIEKIKEINLEAFQSSLAFEFSAIGDVLYPNYKYSYKLEGFDNYWKQPMKDKMAVYTNIPPGEYTFTVRAGTKQGLWDIGQRSIKIHIKPVWWKSTTAYIFYAIIILALLYSIFSWIKIKDRLLREAWENKKEKELHSTKMSFFAKMSHEIQTPLTLILGPIDEMLERARINNDKLLEQRLIMIKNNAQRLSRIANDLMTVRNHELGEVKINAGKYNIVKDLKNISASFELQARFKNIDFTQKYDDSKIQIWYDKDKLEHILYNLLANAFKFTPSNGNIELKCENKTEEEKLVISITNSGSIIPEDELNEIFKIFYRSKNASKHKGSGIGLAFAKEMTDLLKGKIEVKSSEKEGTTFTVTLSTRDDVFSEKEKLNTDEYEETSDQISLNSYEEYETTDENKNEKKYTILVVEDNVEMQIFLSNILSKNYNVLLAENGKKGIELAEKHNPDLIISDIMMPVMDGMDMSKYLKNKKTTSHIPIIILTAKNSIKYKIDGLKIGVMEVMRKPFSSNELNLKVKNVLDQRDKTISKYRKDSISSTNSFESKSKDDIFLEELVKNINEHLEDSDFKIEELADKMNMSYSVLYKRCKEITGKSLVEFVRYMKLKHAAVLILKNGYYISEASYMVGYKDSKYFTKCFKDEFGITPNKMKKEKEQNGVDEILNKYNLTTH